jgi:hypothetical protein
MLLGNKQDLTTLFLKLLRKLFDSPVLHNAGVTVVNTGRKFALRGTIRAEVTYVGRNRNVGKLPFIPFNLPRTYLKYLDAPFTFRNIMLFLARYFTGMTVGTKFVIYQDSFARH